VFIKAKGDGGGGDNWTTGAISLAKFQSNRQHQQTNIHFFTGRMPFLSPNQAVCSRNALYKSTFYLLTYLLTTNSVKALKGNLNQNTIVFNHHQ